MDYQTFLASKQIAFDSRGIEPWEPHCKLFDFQRDIVKWALRRGRACIWADCGMGKTFMQVEWAKQIPGDVLILAPLAVASQTISEAEKLGVRVRYCRGQSEVEPGITIANYEMLTHFDTNRFQGVVLDESSILKSFMGKTKRDILARFNATPYRLACTATPAPNDYMEIGNHVEFMGVMRSSEMLSRFFINDGSEVGRYRLKGHAANAFWEWLASFCVMIRKPSDLGYSDDGFTLPPLNRQFHIVDVTKPAEGMLFALPAATLSERISARRESVSERVSLAADLCNASDEQWLVFCNLNSESESLKKSIDGSVEVRGSDSIEHKCQALQDFADGKIRVLVSKSTICGFGMNFQRCRNVCFVGLTDSWEQYYQAVRRCWRFGQQREVNCHIVIASTEGAVLENIMRKEEDAERMATNIAKNMAYISLGEIKNTEGFRRKYNAETEIEIPEFL